MLSLEFDKSDSVSFRLMLAVSDRSNDSKFPHAQLFCAWTRARAKLAGARVRLTRVRAVRPLSRLGAPHTRVSQANSRAYRGREYIHAAGFPIWRASTRHGVCMRVYAPPLVRGVRVYLHTWRHACGSLCVGTQTKGGKPVSSGAPERREQPFYSIPGGKRVARSSRRRRRTTSTTSTATTASCSRVASRRDTATSGRRWR